MEGGRLSHIITLYSSRVIFCTAERGSLQYGDWEVPWAMKKSNILFITIIVVLSGATAFSELAQSAKKGCNAHKMAGRPVMGSISGALGQGTGRHTMMTATTEKSDTQKEKPEDRSPEAGSTYDRIQQGVHDGKISLKEGVLLAARLFYAPALIPEDSEYAPRPGEPMMGPEESMTGFYKDLHRVKGELTEEEKFWLRSLSPDMEAIIGN